MPNRPISKPLNQVMTVKELFNSSKSYSDYGVKDIIHHKNFGEPSQFYVFYNDYSRRLCSPNHLLYKQC